MQYKFAENDGSFVIEEYDEKTRLTQEEVKNILIDAFRTNGQAVSVEDVMDEVYKVTYGPASETCTVYVSAKPTTPGGRGTALADEQRILQLPKYLNCVASKQDAGEKAISIGVYRRNEGIVICAWKVSHSNAAEASRVSKQIKIDTIAQAMKIGFAQQSRGQSEYVCAFRKEFIHFYIRHAEWLHGSAVTELPEHNDAIADDTDVDNEATFKMWLAGVRKDNGERYSENTQNQYISAMKAVPSVFQDILSPFKTIFCINDVDSFDRFTSDLRAAANFDEFNRSRGNGSLSACLALYRRFLENGAIAVNPIRFSTGLINEYPRNRILFGAPGTGKSFTLNSDRKELLYGERNVDEDTIDHRLYGEYERVTFHPDYSYANFVGTYKPVPYRDNEDKDSITYSYVPGPFMRTYVKALRNSRTDVPKPYLLVIEEINRANVAAVFGDVFQLLDRGDNEVSEYPIQASEDIKKYLARELGGDPEDYSEIRIPDNMFIWATMNSADQGVFPMDTAFKRRWDFTYLGIDNSEAKIAGKKVTLGQGDYRRVVEWNELRKAINNELLTYKVNEDKLMGPFFISKKSLPEGEVIDPAVFTRIFKNKVIMYLFDDAAKQKRITLFGGCDEKAKNQYSKICREFDTKGVYIFCEGISSQFIDNVPEDDGE